MGGTVKVRAVKFTFQYGSTSMIYAVVSYRLFNHLHSNMVLLQLVVWYGVISCMWNLHSNMVLLQSVDDRKRMLGHAFKFTFQYGSTSMVSSILYPNAPATFTFQYGSTSILLLISADIAWVNLHSNMVLLQFSREWWN